VLSGAKQCRDSYDFVVRTVTQALEALIMRETAYRRGRGIDERPRGATPGPGPLSLPCGKKLNNKGDAVTVTGGSYCKSVLMVHVHR
jgi:hypothetical protein